MRVLGVIVMFTMVTMAGCTTSVEPATTAPTLDHPMERSDFSWDPVPPVVGQPATFKASVRSGVPDNSIDRLIWDFGPVQLTDVQPTYTFESAGPHTVSVRIQTAKASDWIVERTVHVVANAGDAAPPPSSEPISRSDGNETVSNETVEPVVPAPALPARSFDCGETIVNETYLNHGLGDATISDLQWAVMKTGHRFAVTFEGDGGPATLTYRLGANGQEQSLTSTDATHLFALDGLTEGRTLCFRVDDGRASDWHAVHLGNAMKAYDDQYTVNFLVMANERTNMVILEKASASFAQRMYDATDGHIRVGSVIVVKDDYERQQEAHQPCWNGNPGLHVSAFSSVLCERLYDMIFTHNVHPLAAGATYKDGIQDPDVTVWMNAIHEAGLYNRYGGENAAVKEVAVVMLHEVGHYMIGAQDLYPEGDVVTEDCYQATTGISIMGGSRDATEFDGEDVPCRTANSSYQPTWQLMTDRFPMIPDRVGGTVPGPDGDGGAYAYRQVTIGL